MSEIDELLNKSCPDDIKYVPLGRICHRQKGISITAAQMKILNKENGAIKIFAGGNTVAFVNYGDIPNENVITKESIIVKSRGKIGFDYYNGPFSHKNEMWSYSCDNEQISLKFIYYYLNAHTEDFQKVAMTGKLPQISIPVTENYPVPVPPIEVQNRIVEILDRLTTLETELEAELKAELEARKKQYEYYRDKLLTFRRKEETSP